MNSRYRLRYRVFGLCTSVIEVARVAQMWRSATAAMDFGYTAADGWGRGLGRRYVSRGHKFRK